MALSDSYIVKQVKKSRVYFCGPGGYRWIIFGLLSLLYFLACLHRISPTVIARDLALEFGADATALGLMASSYFYLYAAVQPPVGVLSDTLGPRAVIAIFTLIAGLGVLFFGLAPDMTFATAGRALIGIGVGGVFIPALKIFSNWFEKREFAGITGTFLAFGNAGNLSASLPLTYLVLLLGWRSSFVAIGGLTLMLVLISWRVVGNKPEDRGWAPVDNGPGENPVDAAAAPEGIKIGSRLKMVLGNPAFWMVTVSYFFFGGPALTFQGLWAVPYLMDVHGYSRLTAGGLLMLIPLGFIVGAPLFGFLSDRLPIGRKSVLVASLSISTACWAVFLFSGSRPPAGIIGPLFLTIGACGGGSLSLYFSIIKELFPPWLTGTAIGLMNPAAFLSTAIFQPFSGWLMDAVGQNGTAYPLEAYHHVFIAFNTSILIGFLAAIPLILPERPKLSGR